MLECCAVGVFLRTYFDRVYNPLYDATTASLSRYRILQARCIQALQLETARRILCVGLGTGNEAVTVLQAAPHLGLSGIDLSPAALVKSRRKLHRLGRSADLQLMDAAALRYGDNCFDRVLCIHVLDFVDDVRAPIREIVRVLSPGGRFALTMPSRPEGTSLGVSLARDQIRTSLRSGRSALGVAAELLLRSLFGLLYLPLLARPQRRSFSPQQVRRLFAMLPVHQIIVDEERAYQDYIVSGVKASSS